MPHLLKLCYFLIVILLISCGEESSQKKEAQDDGSANPDTVVAQDSDSRTILFFGNSLTAGYGLEPEEAFPALIQDRLDSLDLDFDVINAGLSGETTSGGLNRLDWVLNQPADVFILELGANDGLRGIPLTETRSNLQAIIDAVRAKNPETKIILAGMQIPPNMGPDYTQEFRSIFPELAESNNTALIPFLLEDVAARPELNLEDGIHPNVEGQKIVAENVWEVLSPILRDESL